MNWFLDYISNVQKKSPEEKKKFALIVSVVITSIIFALWLSAQVIKKDEIVKEIGSIRIEPAVELNATVEEATKGLSEAKGIFETIKNAINMAN